MSIALPQREIGTDEQSTPRAVNGKLSLNTPGMNIGLATPGAALVNARHQNPMSPSGDMKSPNTMMTPWRGSLDKVGDYFTARPQTGTATTPGGGATTPRAPQTPSETDERTPMAELEKTNSSLFGKKFRMSFAGKRLGTNTKLPAEAMKPVVADEVPKQESDTESRSSKAEEEQTFVNSFYGVLQQMRQEYAQNTEKANSTPETLITPCMPNETPVLKPPVTTTVLIQEESHNSAGMTDLFEGRLNTLARQADLLERVAPFWLGDLLLRVG